MKLTKVPDSQLRRSKWFYQHINSKLSTQHVFHYTPNSFGVVYTTPNTQHTGKLWS